MLAVSDDLRDVVVFHQPVSNRGAILRSHQHIQIADRVAFLKRGHDPVGNLDSALPIAYGILPVSDLTKLGWRSNWVPKDLDVVLRRRSPDRRSISYASDLSPLD